MIDRDRSARKEQVFARLMYNVRNPPVGWDYAPPVSRKGNQPGQPITTKSGSHPNRQAAQLTLTERQHDYQMKRAAAEAETNLSRDRRIRHQAITILTQLCGPQHVTASAHNAGSAEAYLLVVIGTVMLTISDAKTANHYATVWTDEATGMLSMKWAPPQRTKVSRYNAPAVSVMATATDPIHTKRTDSLTIIIGRVVWQVMDARAFTDVHAMWREVKNRSPEIWTK